MSFSLLHKLRSTQYIMDAKRQQQVSKLIQENMAAILQKHGSNLYSNTLVTVTEVRTSPDLSFAKVYISIYDKDKRETIIDYMNQNMGELRGLLGAKIKNRVRKIPELKFVLDDTLDTVYRLEEIFNEIKKQKKK